MLVPGISSQRGSPWHRATCCCRSFSTDQTDGRGAACCQVGPAARTARGGSSPRRALGQALPVFPCPTAGFASPCHPCPLCPCPAACQPSPSPAAGRLCPVAPCCHVWAPGHLSLWQLSLSQGRHGPRCSGRLISLWFWLLRLESSWGGGRWEDEPDPAIAALPLRIFFFFNSLSIWGLGWAIRRAEPVRPPLVAPRRQSRGERSGNEPGRAGPR